MLLSELSSLTPGGAQTLSKMACRYPANYPKSLVKGRGGKVTDNEGREYIDLISGLGCISVGYTNAEVDQAIREQMQNGISFSLPNEIEYLAAKKLNELVPGTEMWKYGKSGTDGVLMAVRAARAYTGRSKILTMGYHGCTDHFECLGTRRAGMVDLSDFTKKFDGSLGWNDTCYAALVLEPFIYEPVITKFLREWCDDTGTLLIADEVVTGGRFARFTASRYMGIVPDLYVLGKGLANGMPLCAVGGKREFMSTFEREDFFASGTFNGETLSLAAFLASAPILERTLDQRIWNGSRIKEAFNKLPWKEAKCVGYPTRLDFVFPDLVEKYKFWQEMCKREVLVGYNNFIMADHTDEDTTKIIDAIFETYKVFDKVNLEGPLPEAAIKRTNG